MNERYSRLFLLPTNLYVEDSPVLIAAGALLKDNLTNKVLVQLKFRNISQKAIKSVKVKVNAYDTAKEQLDGIDTFSYLDLSIAANEEFGQSTPINLPDTTTRSFSVEILSVVYTDNDVFTPHTVSVAEAAPKDILEKVQRVETEKKAAREAIITEQTKQAKNKQSQWIMVFSFVSSASVILSIILNLIAGISYNSVTYLFALIVPCFCLLTAFAVKKNSAIIKPALIICVTLSALKIVFIIIYAVLELNYFIYKDYRELLFLFNQLSRYVNGSGFGIFLGKFMISGNGNRFIFPSFFAVLPNILCPTVLAIYKRIK